MLLGAVAASVSVAGCGAKSTPVVEAAPTTTGPSSVPTTSADVEVPTTTPDTEAPGDTTAPTTTPDDTTHAGPPPDTPTGTFLSTHRLSISGEGVPAEARSVCTTSVGATCVIEFTNGQETRTLGPTEVDASGNATWNWSPSNIGLTPGEWAVRVTATNAAGSTSVDEAIGLEVLP